MAKSIRELPLMEQLAIEQALFSKLGEDVSTKNPDSLRSAIDGEIVGNYRATGAKSYDVHVNGEKVGTYSVRVGKGAPAKTTKNMIVLDQMKLEQFATSDECAEERAEYIALMARNFAEWMLETYGIICDGCDVVENEIPAKPSTVLGTTLRIDSEKVSEAIHGYLPTTIAGFIGGSDD